ncbi:MAG: precorrin-6y C5,15-methyltransferase (decarboxylating) subunit CbiE [Desulfobacterales bacterium]
MIPDTPPENTSSPIPVSVVGMGMSRTDLTAGHVEVIRGAQVLIGGRRHLDAFGDLDVEKRVIDRRISELIAFIESRRIEKKVVVLASGDPLYYGIGSVLAEQLGRDAVRFYPNITSVAAAFSRMGEPWQEAAVVSLHGRDQVQRLRKALCRSSRVAVFTDPDRGPSWLGRWLEREGWPDARICVLERMGDPQERILWCGTAEAADGDFREPNLAVVIPGSRSLSLDPPIWIGMPVDRFHHEAGLITKSEVRAVVLSRLRPGPGQTLWDLGAGSGAVGIEASALMPGGRIYAVEKNSARVQQIHRNCESFGLTRIEVVEAVLPHGLSELPDPDRIFIGGGGSALRPLLTVALERLKPAGVIVVNTVLLSSLETARQVLEAHGCPPDICQIQVSRAVPISGGQRLEAENPVWIVSGRKT